MSRISTWETGRNGKASALKAAAVGVAPTWGFKSLMSGFGRGTLRTCRTKTKRGWQSIRKNGSRISGWHGCARTDLAPCAGEKTVCRCTIGIGRRRSHIVSGRGPLRVGWRSWRSAWSCAAPVISGSRSARVRAPLRHTERCRDTYTAVVVATSVWRAVDPTGSIVICDGRHGRAGSPSRRRWRTISGSSRGILPCRAWCPSSPSKTSVERGVGVARRNVAPVAPVQIRPLDQRCDVAQWPVHPAVNREDVRSSRTVAAMCPCPNWQRSRSQKPEDPGSTPGGHTGRASTPAGRGTALRRLTGGVRIPGRPPRTGNSTVELTRLRI